VLVVVDRHVLDEKQKDDDDDRAGSDNTPRRTLAMEAGRGRSVLVVATKADDSSSNSKTMPNNNMTHDGADPTMIVFANDV
jgi:hypothetical protein